MEKLVRDKIPGIIHASGTEPEVRAADPSELASLMRRKIWEEIDELERAKTPEDIAEESADALEIIEAYCRLHGVTMEQVMHVKMRKLDEKGGFERGLVLRIQPSEKSE